MEIGLDEDVRLRLKLPQRLQHLTIGLHRFVKIISQLVDAQHHEDAVVAFLSQQLGEQQPLLPGGVHLPVEHIIDAHARAGKKVRSLNAGVFLDAHRAAVPHEQSVGKGILRLHRPGRLLRQIIGKGDVCLGQ